MANSAGFPLSVWGYIARVARHAWGFKTSQVWGELRDRHRTWRYQWSEGKLLDHEWLGLDLDHSYEICLDNT
jgi:hypothetical protein